MTVPAPNRPLNLDELDCEPFETIVKKLEYLDNQYDQYYLHPSKRWEYPWALQQADLNRHSRILDAGCGKSVFPLYLTQKDWEVYACDLDLPDQAERIHRDNLHYAEADLVELPWEDNTFDVVFLISVLEHLPRNKMPEALDEISRVLPPGGQLMFTTDYYKDASAPLRYTGPGEEFEVDWNVFDRQQLEDVILDSDKFELSGDLDLDIDWHTMETQMRDFHGYAYTSIGLKLIRQ